jgi:AcrR family transcriptional regulator
MRADARRNHAALLDVARDLFVERGPDVALDDIARRAGVGIGTLYRRFPDRRALMAAVVLTALERTADAAEQAARTEPDAFRALAAYMHTVIDLRTPAVIPIVLGHLDLESPPINSARERSAAGIQHLIDTAHRAGSLRTDVTFADIGLMLVRIARPLPGPMQPDLQAALAHRHIDLLLGALHAPPETPLSGPALQRHDLRRTATPRPGTRR